MALYVKDFGADGLYQSPDGAIRLSQPFKKAVVKQFRRAKRNGILVPVAWGHTPAYADDEDDMEFWRNKYVAGYIDDLRLLKNGLLRAVIDIPRPEDQSRIGTTIREVSGTFIDQFEDGKGRAYRPFMVQLSLTAYPVEPAQGNFRVVSEDGRQVEIVGASRPTVKEFPAAIAMGLRRWVNFGDGTLTPFKGVAMSGHKKKMASDAEFRKSAGKVSGVKMKGPDVKDAARATASRVSTASVDDAIGDAKFGSAEAKTKKRFGDFAKRGGVKPPKRAKREMGVSHEEAEEVYRKHGFAPAYDHEDMIQKYGRSSGHYDHGMSPKAVERFARTTAAEAEHRASNAHEDSTYDARGGDVYEVGTMQVAARNGRKRLKQLASKGLTPPKRAKKREMGADDDTHGVEGATPAERKRKLRESQQWLNAADDESDWDDVKDFGDVNPGESFAEAVIRKRANRKHATFNRGSKKNMALDDAPDDDEDEIDGDSPEDANDFLTESEVEDSDMAEGESGGDSMDDDDVLDDESDMDEADMDDAEDSFDEDDDSLDDESVPAFGDDYADEGDEFLDDEEDEFLDEEEEETADYDADDSGDSGDSGDDRAIRAMTKARQFARQLKLVLDDDISDPIDMLEHFVTSLRTKFAADGGSESDAGGGAGDFGDGASNLFGGAEEDGEGEDDLSDFDFDFGDGGAGGPEAEPDEEAEEQPQMSGAGGIGMSLNGQVAAVVKADQEQLRQNRVQAVTRCFHEGRCSKQTARELLGELLNPQFRMSRDPRTGRVVRNSIDERIRIIGQNKPGTFGNFVSDDDGDTDGAVEEREQNLGAASRRMGLGGTDQKPSKREIDAVVAANMRLLGLRKS